MAVPPRVQPYNDGSALHNVQSDFTIKRRTPWGHNPYYENPNSEGLFDHFLKPRAIHYHPTAPVTFYSIYCQSGCFLFYKRMIWKRRPPRCRCPVGRLAVCYSGEMRTPSAF